MIEGILGSVGNALGNPKNAFVQCNATEDYCTSIATFLNFDNNYEIQNFVDEDTKL